MKRLGIAGFPQGLIDFQNIVAVHRRSAAAEAEPHINQLHIAGTRIDQMMRKKRWNQQSASRLHGDLPIPKAIDSPISFHIIVAPAGVAVRQSPFTAFIFHVSQEIQRSKHWVLKVDALIEHIIFFFQRHLQFLPSAWSRRVLVRSKHPNIYPETSKGEKSLLFSPLPQILQ